MVATDQRVRPWFSSTGWWCIALGVVHLVTTGVFYADSLSELFSGPFVGALDADPDHPAERGAAFWYMATGLLLMALGWSARQAETSGHPPTDAFGISLILLGVIGVVASPLSGFWIVLLIGAVAFWRNHRTDRAQ